jgi:polyisoprenoid-binding protein YceI
MVRTTALWIFAALLLSGAAQAAESYEMDRSHSSIGFAVRHFGVSNVRGEFKNYSLELWLDEGNPANSSVTVTIDSASIFTDHEQRDQHLKSGDFLDVESHPTITFSSKKMEPKGEGEFSVTGDLIIRGVTREVVMPVTLAGPLKDPLGMMRVGIEGSLTIDRQEYGVSWSRVMDNGGLFVGNDVKIGFSIEAARKIDGGEEG